MGYLAPNVCNMWADVSLWGHLSGILWPRTHGSACFSQFEQHVSPSLFALGHMAGYHQPRTPTQPRKWNHMCCSQKKFIFLLHRKDKSLISANASFT